MAIVSAYNETGLTVFAVIRDSALKFADVVAEALEDYDAGSIGDYDIQANEIGDIGEYHVTWPSWLPVGLYTIQFAPQAGGSPAVSDLPNRFAVQSYYWDGVSLVPDWAVKLVRSAAPVESSVEATVATNLDAKVSNVVNQAVPATPTANTLGHYIQVIDAIVGGVVVVSGNTNAFKNRSNTTVRTVTYGTGDGQRTGSTLA